jgi:hypothetical protein
MATYLIAVAEESGALTQSQSGNTITVQANPYHLYREIFTGTPDLGYFSDGPTVLSNLSISASLAANANSTLSAPTTGSATSTQINTQTVSVNSSATKLSSLTVNYDFNNHLSPNKIKKVTTVVVPDATLLANLSASRSTLASDFSAAVFSSTCSDAKYASNKATFQAAAASNPTAALGSFIGYFNACFDEIATAAEKANPKVSSDLQAFTTAFQADIADFQSKLAKQVSSWDVSAQYVYSRPVSQPETHDIRFIATEMLTSLWAANGR